MVKEIRDERQRWLRVGGFLLICAALIWYLSSQAAIERLGDARVKSESTTKEPQTSENFRILGEKINRILPEKVKERFSETTGEFSKKSSEVIEQTKVVQQIKTTIQQAAEEISGFPEKQEKQIRREIIQQICDDLLKEEE